MLIKIYNSKGIEQAELSPNDNSTLAEEIQGDSILSLSFTHFDYIELDVDYYTDFEGKRYWLTEKYKPKQNNKEEWVYDVKFYGVESMLKRLLVIKTVDNEEDPVFTLTAPPHEHVAMIVGCMNKGMGNITDWKVGLIEGTENIVIDYFGKYCDEALREIAEKTGGEWWIEGQTVNVCRCEHGEPVKLGYGEGLLSIDPGRADNVKFYTRLYPIGSSKNIDKEHYGYSRLQLPDGKKFVEINAEKYGRVDHYEQDAFSDIFPRRIGEISHVRSEEIIGEDGNPFSVYYFQDEGIPFDPNDYLLPGKVLRVSFQEGSELGGLGNEENGTYYFEVNYDSEHREFEIITIWPYGDDIQLPGEKLVPKAGDKYLLWNLRMPDEYYTLAEAEFLEAVNKYNEEHGLDIAVYKGPTDHVWIERNKIELSIGRRVRLESEVYFPDTGYRESRITRITRKVNLPSSMDIEISDALSRTSQGKMRDDITDVRRYARSIGESVSLPDIIRTGDNTKATDNNLYSALRILSDFLSKKKNDRTPFDLSVGGEFVAESIARFFGVAQSKEFMSGLMRGFGWLIDSSGNAEVESIRVRSFMEIAELIFNRLSASQTDQSFTEGDTIESVTENEDGTYTLRLKEEWEGYFTSQYEFNVIRGIYNNISNSVTGKGTTVVNNATYYTSWMRVLSVDAPKNIIRVSLYDDDQVPAGRNFPPVELMKIARWGNSGPAYDDRGNLTEYGRRQWCFELSGREGRLTFYNNVTKPIIDASNVAALIGRCPDFLAGVNRDVKEGQVIIYIPQILTRQIVHVDGFWLPLPTIIYRGYWNPDEYYYGGDTVLDPEGNKRFTDGGELLNERSRVTYWGCTWLCNDTGTKTPPSWTGNDWTLESGIDTMFLDFDTTQDSVYADNPQITLGVICRISTQDMTHDPSVSYNWTRRSWHGDVEDTASDNLWNNANKNAGPSKTLLRDDFNYAFGMPPTKLLITVTATLLDPEGKPVLSRLNGQPYSQSVEFDF
ncbi:MAG: hypothetical protein J1E95_04230 [Muribaculaceae bacterium]|nr:hypothetical protein [Muribaculaceae bacterium]